MGTYSKPEPGIARTDSGGKVIKVSDGVQCEPEGRKDANSISRGKAGSSIEVLHPPGKLMDKADSMGKKMFADAVTEKKLDTTPPKRGTTNIVQ